MPLQAFRILSAYVHPLRRNDYLLIVYTGSSKTALKERVESVAVIAIRHHHQIPRARGV